MTMIYSKFTAAAVAMLSLTNTVSSVQAQDQEKTCECKDLSGSFIVTRLWDIIDPEWNDQMVIDEFDRGFAPEVTHLEGFQEYVSAFTSVPDTVFFMNVFESKELAKAAQEGAKLFVQRGVLNGKITPNQFTENELSFYFSSQECVTEPYAGEYMGTQIFTLTETAIAETLSLQQVIDQVQQEFSANVTAMDGFLEYGGSLVTGTDLVFFFVVFDSTEGVAAANDAMTSFVTDSSLSEMIEPVAITAGAVDFDYTCAAGNIPPPAETMDEPMGGPSSAPSNLGIHRILLLIPTLLALFF